jgi:hypothetical protein
MSMGWDRSCKIAEMREEGMTLAKIGEHFGVSRQRVLQILQRREEILEQGISPSAIRKLIGNNRPGWDSLPSVVEWKEKAQS